MVRPVQTVTSYRTTDGEIWHSEDEAQDHQFRLDEDELEAVFQRLVDVTKGEVPEINRATAEVIVKNIMLSREAWDFFGGIRFNRDDIYFFLDCKGFDV